ILQYATEGGAKARRAWKILPLERMGIRRVPARHPLDWRLQRVETMFLDKRGKLGSETTGLGSFMDHDAMPGLFDRLNNRVEIQRHQRAQIEDLGVDPGLFGGSQGDMHHGPVSEDRHIP